jgi:hypothetical protein
MILESWSATTCLTRRFSNRRNTMAVGSSSMASDCVNIGKYKMNQMRGGAPGW